MKTPTLPLLLISLVYLAELLLQPAHACMPWRKRKQPSKHRHPTCDCYVVSGPDPGYFQHYQFWDFRNVPLPDDEAEDSDDAGAQSSRSRGNGRSSKKTQKAVLLSDTPFSDDWHVQKWQRDGSQIYPVPMINAENNVFITRSSSRGRSGPKRRRASTHLVLRTVRFENFASTAEIESRIRDFMHCSVRVRFRLMGADEKVLEPSSMQSTTQEEEEEYGTSDEAADSDSDLVSNTNSHQLTPQQQHSQSQQRRGGRGPANRPPPSGACAGIFTYFSKDVESDIEILTSDPPTRIRYANQPDWDPATDQMIPNASTVATIPVPWTVWATHRLDWFPTVSRWYVNDLVQDTKTYHVPDRPSMIALNLWSNGGEWTGDLKPGESVHMAIEWIEIAYNVSSSSTAARRKTNKRAGKGNMLSFIADDDGDDDDLGGDEYRASDGDIPNTVMNLTDDAAAVASAQCLHPCNIDDLLRRRTKRNSKSGFSLFDFVRP